MTTQIVIDEFGEWRYRFDASSSIQILKAKERFEVLRAAGFLAAGRSAAGQVTIARSFDVTAAETVFYPRLVGGPPTVFIRLGQAGRRAVCRSLAWIAPTHARKAQHGAFDGAREREPGGEELLTEWLSPEQRAQFDANRWFDVIGSHTEKGYRIYDEIPANVHELAEGRPQVALWFGPAGQLSPGSRMLSQKIALETDEPATLVIARRSRIRSDRRNSDIRKRAF